MTASSYWERPPLLLVLPLASPLTQHYHFIVIVMSSSTSSSSDHNNYHYYFIIIIIVIYNVIACYASCFALKQFILVISVIFACLFALTTIHLYHRDHHCNLSRSITPPSIHQFTLALATHLFGLFCFCYFCLFLVLLILAVLA